MTHTQTTTTNSYQQLGFDERGAIEAMHTQGFSCRGFALELHRSPSTISRELRSGAVNHMNSSRQIHAQYFADAAQAWHERAQLNSHEYGPLDFCDYFFKDLVKALRQRPRIQSSDSFVYAFQMQFPHLCCPSTSIVYRCIDQGLLPMTNIDLPMRLRHPVKHPS